MMAPRQKDVPMKRSQPFRLIRALAALSLSALISVPAHAVVNGTATSSFSAVGAIGGASGVQITDNWVLTAAHVANGVLADVTTFESVVGSSTIDAVYTFTSAEFPNHDIALLHLSTAIESDELPVLNAQLYTKTAAMGLGEVTIVSAQNASPNGYGVATVKSAMTNSKEDGKTATVNWLITQGEVHVQGGDSGGALFKGTPDDSGGAVLLGIASASLLNGSNTPTSAFVQTAAYKNWIDSTMMSSGQQALWSSSALAVQAAANSVSVVPEPGTAALYLLGALGALACRPIRQRLLG